MAKEAIVSIAAILNKRKSGELYFGIKDDGKVVGQMVTGKTIRDLAGMIARNIEPQIYPEIEHIIFERKSCIKVIFSGEDTPYFAYGRAYMRVGDEDRRLSAKELENLIVKKNEHISRWDCALCKQAKFKDISATKVKEFLKYAGLQYGGLGSSLTSLGIMKNRILTNAALLLFGKSPGRFFPNARLRCAVFATETTAMILDMHDYEDDIFALIKKAEEYILGHINIGMRLEGLRRIDMPEIDREAFREAIINAFCHREYREYDSVNIAIFKDRIEIRSPGGLLDGLTISRIRKEMISKRRNELIADMFHRVHFVERWGRGISLILSKEPNTQFKEVAGIFMTVFPRKKKEKWSEKWSENQLSERQVKILELIRLNPKISRKELAAALNINQSAVQRHLKILKGCSILERIGPAKGGHWKVREKIADSGS